MPLCMTNKFEPHSPLFLANQVAHVIDVLGHVSPSGFGRLDIHDGRMNGILYIGFLEKNCQQ